MAATETPARPDGQTPSKPTSKPASRTSARRKTPTSRAKPAAKTPTGTARPAAKPARGTRSGFDGRDWAVELLDMQEQTVRSVADYQLRAADSTRLPWVATIARGQADVLVGVTDAYVSAARRLLVK